MKDCEILYSRIQSTTDKTELQKQSQVMLQLTAKFWSNPFHEFASQLNFQVIGPLGSTYLDSFLEQDRKTPTGETTFYMTKWGFDSGAESFSRFLWKYALNKNIQDYFKVEAAQNAFLNTLHAEARKQGKPLGEKEADLQNAKKRLSDFFSQSIEKQYAQERKPIVQKAFNGKEEAEEFLNALQKSIKKMPVTHLQSLRERAYELLPNEFLLPSRQDALNYIQGNAALEQIYNAAIKKLSDSEFFSLEKSVPALSVASAEAQKAPMDPVLNSITWLSAVNQDAAKDLENLWKQSHPHQSADKMNELIWATLLSDMMPNIFEKKLILFTVEKIIQSKKQDFQSVLPNMNLNIPLTYIQIAQAVQEKPQFFGPDIVNFVLSHESYSPKNPATAQFVNSRKEDLKTFFQKKAQTLWDTGLRDEDEKFHGEKMVFLEAFFNPLYERMPADEREEIEKKAWKVIQIALQYQSEPETLSDQLATVIND